MASIGKTSIDVEGLELRNLTTEEKGHLPRVREKTLELGQEALEEYLKTPEDLALKDFNAEELLQHIQKANELEPYEKWLEEKLELMRETRLFHHGEIRRGVDRLAKRVRVLAEDDESLRSRFAPLLDFYSEPARKAKETRNNKKES